MNNADLCTLARDQGVSTSWMVRRAVQQLVSQHHGEVLPELPLQRSAGVRRSQSA